MRRLGSVGFAWLIVLLLLATPLMSVAPTSVAAQTEEGTPISGELPSGETPVDEPTEPATEPSPTVDPGDPSVTPEEPTSEPTGEASPPVDGSPTGEPAETTTPEPTSTDEPTEEPAEFNAAVISDISIEFDCTALPESIKVTNVGTGTIDLTSIGTFVDLVPGEPWALSRTLSPGERALFQAGPGAKYGTILSDTTDILTDSAYDAEGVQVQTSVGPATAMCAPKPPPPAGQLSDISISLKCNTSPETIRVTNNGAGYIKLQGIGTFVDLVGGEPWALDRWLRPGKTAIFQAGQGAQYGTILSERYILTNSAYDQEGVKVSTDVGLATQMCPPKPEPPAGELSDLTVTLSCTTDPESIRVKNNGDGYITIKGIATYLDPIAEEPFAVERVVRPGMTASFSAGTGAKYGTILTRQFIFTNAAYEKEGVRINTSVGKVTKACPPKPVPQEKWIEVNLSAQYLTAWYGNTRVNGTLVSTGKPGFETPTGTFYILTRYRYDTMAGCIQGECYYVPDVPWTQYFTNYGHALHGAYWHNDFGTTRSHGCVNLPLWFAEWLWNWATWGTRIWIHY